MKKEIKALHAALVAQGWTVVYTGSGHFKATPPCKTMRIVVMSSTPSSQGAVKAMVRDCVKSGFDASVL